MHCPGGNATDLIWRVLASSDRISRWTSLKPQHSNPNPNPLANLLWSIDFLTPPRLSSSLTDSLPSLNLLCHSKTDARFIQDAPKAVWSIPYVSVAFLSKYETEFYFISSSRPECIFKIYQLWQSGFSRVYSNCCCSCSFEPEIIKISQSSHTMYSNNIVNFQESATISNGCTKMSGNLFNAPRTYIHTYAFGWYIEIFTKLSFSWIILDSPTYQIHWWNISKLLICVWQDPQSTIVYLIWSKELRHSLHFPFRFLCWICINPSWIIYIQSNLDRKKVVLLLFNPLLGRIRGFISCPRVVVRKMNVIFRLEFELAHNDVAFDYDSHYPAATLPPPRILRYLEPPRTSCIKLSFTCRVRCARKSDELEICE